MFLRVIIFALGISLLSFGISTVTGAGLGTGTISAIPFVLMKYTGLSMGTFVFAVNLFFFFVQSALDHREIVKRFCLQIPCMFLFATMIDLTLPLVNGLANADYLLQIAMCVVGAGIIGLGVSCMVRASITVLPPEGAVIALMHRLGGGSFGTLRLYLDIILVITAVGASYLLLGHLDGVREGTVIAALCTGPSANIFLRLMGQTGKAKSPKK